MQNIQNKAKTIYQTLKKKYPDARIELNYNNPLELTVATILSAQCTDTKVNEVTAKLFQKYKSPADYLNVPQEELENDIRQLGFYRRKAQSLTQLLDKLTNEYNGSIPNDLNSLTSLPGIGRKTANIILGNAFNIPGIAVDTHVKRVTNRLGLTDNKQPEKIEADLMELYPESEWVQLSNVFIFHGRYTCKAKKPDCENCPVNNLCRYYSNLE